MRIFLFLFIVLSSQLSAQDTIKISLDVAIETAKHYSREQRIADHTYTLAYWTYQRYKASLNPRVSISGTLPNYYRTINPITLPNGASDFVSQNIASSSINLSATQNVGLTGGTLSIGTSLYRIDNFGSYKNTAYTSVPFTVSYSQQNIFFNPIKWDKKVELLKISEAESKKIESFEEIAIKTTELYCDLLQAETRLRLDLQNEKNIIDLLRALEARLEIGTSQLSEVLQSKVSLINAQKSLSNSRLDLKVAKHAFLRFLDLPLASNIKLELPDSVSFYTVDHEVALQESRQNKYFTHNFQRRELELKRELLKTKAETAPVVSIMANLGLTQTGQRAGDAYQNLLNNQSVSMGFFLPIIDWGANKASRKRIQAAMDVEKELISQQSLTAEKEVVYACAKWESIVEQIRLAKLAYVVANETYEIARQKYSIGNYTFSNFNFAQLEKDRAALEYLETMRNYWITKYQIRYLTLYDFETRRKLKGL